MKKRVAIPEETRSQLLLWCARHCCFCGRSCTTNIEIHHIDGDPSNNEPDNLIPVCFDCHGELERYNPKHPKGTKYRFLEIKTRRKQIYEEYTRPYLRQVEIRIDRRRPDGQLRPWGDTSCTVRTLSQDIPVQVRLRLEGYYNEQRLDLGLSDLYAGKMLWNLNPTQIIFGHFHVPALETADPFYYRIEIFWSVIDALKMEHEMLPFSYVWNSLEGDWWFDPCVMGR